MKISVVIPTYNEERYIGQCLDSLAQQRVQPHEIIVVDNNCIDNTVQICKQYKVKVIPEKKQGMVFARNAGYDAATGDIIARTDADTILPPNWIEKIRENFIANKPDGLTGLVKTYDMPLVTPFYTSLFLESVKALTHGKEMMIGPNMSLTTAIWKKIRDHVVNDDALVHEDLDIAFNIYKAGGVVKRDETLIVSMSGRRIKKNPGSFFFEYPIRTFRTIKLYS